MVTMCRNTIVFLGRSGGILFRKMLKSSTLQIAFATICTWADRTIIEGRGKYSHIRRVHIVKTMHSAT